MLLIRAILPLPQWVLASASANCIPSQQFSKQSGGRQIWRWMTIWIWPIWHCKGFSDLTQECVFANMALRALDSHNVWSLHVSTCWAYVCMVMLERIKTSDKACEGLLKSFPFCMHAMDASLPLLRSLGSWRLQRPGRLGRVLDFCWALARFQRLWPRWAEGPPALPHSGGYTCSTYSRSFGLVLDAARCFLLSLCATKTWVASWRQMVTALASEHASDITRKHEKAKPLVAEWIRFTMGSV